MEPLPHEPRNFRELVEADLRRAARLIIKAQDTIDWQFRIATPQADLHLAVTMPGGLERNVMLARIGTFMQWKQATAFIMSVESGLPNGVYAVGVSKTERYNCFSHFNHQPKPWTARNFDRVKWLPERHIEPAIAAMLPTAPRAMTPKEVSGLEAWFGPQGRFAVVDIATGELTKL